MDLSPSSFGEPGYCFRIPVRWLLSDSEGACLRSLWARSECLRRPYRSEVAEQIRRGSFFDVEKGPLRGIKQKFDFS